MNFNKSYTGIRPDLLRHISSSSINLRVLDVGCSTGANGKLLLNRKIAEQVFGIEIDAKMADIAAEEYTEVFVGNLNELTFLENAVKGLKEVDVILIGDVLEHLIDPALVLQRLKTCLTANGRIIFSVPNVQHIDLFIHVFLKGVLAVK